MSRVTSGAWLVAARSVGPALAVATLATPAPAGLEDPAWRTAGVGAWMALWWLTECVPVPATSMVPLAAFPLLGATSLGAAASPYAHPLVFLFLGGFLMAQAMQRWDLHRRLALGIVARIGRTPRRLVVGFLLAAAVSSAWISNTATALMMLPIGLSVVEMVPEGAARDRLSTRLMLGIAYACSVGGLATIIGTPTNALLAGFLADEGRPIAFATWVAFGVPTALGGLAILAIVLTRGLGDDGGLDALPAERLQPPGAWTRGERGVAVVFAVVALSWMTRPWLSRVVPGLSDTGIAMIGSLLLFALPAGDGKQLLEWEQAKRVPYGVLLLFGGGLSLAAAIRSTGLAEWIGARVTVFESGGSLLLLVATLITLVLLTELTSNTATVAAFLPVLAAIEVPGTSPAQLLIPATLAASCAFMLPVATPPNAIVYGGGYVTLREMRRHGLVLNALFVVWLTIAARTWIAWIVHQPPNP